MAAGCGSHGAVTRAESGEYAESIMVFCVAGTKKPMQEIGALFEEKYGTVVDYNFAGSGTLLTQIETTRHGDAFSPGEESYLEKAREKGFINKSSPIAYHVPVIAVPEDNPAGIECLADLAGPGVKVVWGDPKAAAIGKVGNKLLEKNGLKDAVWKNVIATAATVEPLVVYVSEGQADASIIWGDLLENTPNVKVIEIPAEQNVVEVVPVGSLAFSNKKKTANAFVDFCASEEAGKVFESHGFVLYPDDRHEKQE